MTCVAAKEHVDPSWQRWLAQNNIAAINDMVGSLTNPPRSAIAAPAVAAPADLVATSTYVLIHPERYPSLEPDVIAADWEEWLG